MSKFQIIINNIQYYCNISKYKYKSKTQMTKAPSTGFQWYRLSSAPLPAISPDRRKTDVALRIHDLTAYTKI